MPDTKTARTLIRGCEKAAVKRPDPVTVRIADVTAALGNDHPVSETLGKMRRAYEQRRSDIDADEDLTPKQRTKAIGKLAVTAADAKGDDQCPVCGSSRLRSYEWISLPPKPLAEALRSVLNRKPPAKPPSGAKPKPDSAK